MTSPDQPGSGIGPSGIAYGAELLTPNQQGVETDLTGFVPRSNPPLHSDLLRDTAVAFAGAASLKVTCSGAGASEGVDLGGSDLVPVPPRIAVLEGAYYVFSAHLLGPGASVRLSLNWYDVDGVLLSVVPTTVAAADLTGAWQLAGGAGRAIPDASTCRLAIATTAIFAGSFWVDGLSFRTADAVADSTGSVVTGGLASGVNGPGTS